VFTRAPPPVPIPNQINSLHAPLPFFVMSILILFSYLGLSLPGDFFTLLFAFILPIRHMPQQSYRPWYDDPNNIDIAGRTLPDIICSFISLYTSHIKTIQIITCCLSKCYLYCLAYAFVWWYYLQESIICDLMYTHLYVINMERNYI
jgi:hypothetical protein